MAELRASLAAMNGEVLIATGVRPGSAGGSGGGAVHEDFGAAMGAFYAGAMAAFRQAEVRAEQDRAYSEHARHGCCGSGLRAAGYSRVSADTVGSQHATPLGHTPVTR